MRASQCVHLQQEHMGHSKRPDPCYLHWSVFIDAETISIMFLYIHSFVKG